MDYENEFPSRVISVLQKLAEQEKEAVTRSAQRARQRLLDQKVGPGEARDQLQVYLPALCVRRCSSTLRHWRTAFSSRHYRERQDRARPR
jgi:hypothetical protein